MGEWEARSFQNSLETLVQIALHETGTQDYAFLREAPSPARRILWPAVVQSRCIKSLKWIVSLGA
jgi:hypothetical protein